MTDYSYDVQVTVVPMGLSFQATSYVAHRIQSWVRLMIIFPLQ